MEFEKLMNKFEKLEVNIAAAQEHMGEVEMTIMTVS